MRKMNEQRGIVIMLELVSESSRCQSRDIIAVQVVDRFLPGWQSACYAADCKFQNILFKDI